MPEGDTIHKIANFLAPILSGQDVRRIAPPPPKGTSPSAAYRIREIVAQGKHLFIAFDNGLALRSHLGMFGSWHHYPHGVDWKKPAAQASLVLETRDRAYVCFNARDIEWVRTPSIRQRVLATRLGPDLTAGGVSCRDLPPRARAILEPETPLVDVLLDQRVASGIGNVYKSELLFLQGLAPLQVLESTPDAALAACYDLASELLQANLGGGKRVTRPQGDDAGRLWVYGRGGQSCLECGMTLRYARLGRHHRGTVWCERCQDADAQARNSLT